MGLGGAFLCVANHAASRSICLQHLPFDLLLLSHGDALPADATSAVSAVRWGMRCDAHPMNQWTLIFLQGKV